MFSQKEKDRRVTAAKKRVGEAWARERKFREKADEALAEARREEKSLAWLESAPVAEDEPPADSQPEL